MIGFLISLLIVGTIAGYVARMIVPGEDPMSFLPTLALGIVGSYVGGFVGWAIFDRDDAFSPAGIIASIIGAVVVLFLYNLVNSGSSRSSTA